MISKFNLSLVISLLVIVNVKYHLIGDGHKVGNIKDVNEAYQVAKNI